MGTVAVIAYLVAVALFTMVGFLALRLYWRERVRQEAIERRIRRYAGRDESTEPTGV